MGYGCSSILKRPLLWGTPAFLSIEPTNACNLHCLECPTGNGSSKVVKGFASNDLITCMLSYITTSVLHVNLFFQGEPFMHKDIIMFIEKMAAKTFVTISTNGHFFNEKIVRELIEVQPYKIIISFDGLNQETYSKYRIDGDFAKVMSGIQLLRSEKETIKKAFPIIELQCLLFNYTELQQQGIILLAKQLGADTLVFKKAQFYNVANAQDMLPSTGNSRYYIENNELKTKKVLLNRCWRSWNGVVITWNGDVLPCCFDKDKTFVLGNVFTLPFESICKNHKRRNFMQQIINQKQRIAMCNNCT